MITNKVTIRILAVTAALFLLSFFLPSEPQIATANEPAVFIIQIIPGSDPTQIASDYGLILLDSIPSLSIYRMQGATNNLPEELINDPRIIHSAIDQMLNTFEAQQREFGQASGDAEYLQRYFGGSSGDDDYDDDDYDDHEEEEEEEEEDRNKDDKRTLFYFDLSSIPAKANVTSVTANFWLEKGKEFQASNSLYQVTKAWHENSVTWYSIHAEYASPAIATFTLPNKKDFAVVDITTLALDWLNGTQPNHGLMLQANSKDEAKWGSRERDKVAERPFIEITLNGEGLETSTHLKIYASQDSYIDSKKPDKNFGSKDKLSVKDGDKKKSKQTKDGKYIEEGLIVVGDHSYNSAWLTWGPDKVKVRNAHKYATGNNITVAILDTGVDLDHPDLVKHLTDGFDFVDNDSIPNDEPNGVDEDDDGQVDEGAGHGTHIAGIIIGIAPDATLLPVRVLNSDGGGTIFQIVNGIVYAVDQGADIINMSLAAEENSPILEAAINYALAHEVMVVAAANGDHSQLSYPAGYEGVLSVGATEIDDYITDFSEAYAEAVDVFAPGEMIYSTYYDGAYAWWSGSSMAAPFVVGEAALLLERSNDNVKCAAERIVKEVKSVKPKIKSRGRIDIEKAVKKEKCDKNGTTLEVVGGVLFFPLIMKDIP